MYKIEYIILSIKCTMYLEKEAFPLLFNLYDLQWSRSKQRTDRILHRSKVLLSHTMCTSIEYDHVPNVYTNNMEHDLFLQRIHVIEGSNNNLFKISTRF
jgi:hypothetical protein